MSYKTVKNEAVAEFTEQKSRFICYIKPVKTEKDATEFINKIKQKHWDAKHNVYAYVLKDGNVKKFSDDGEPHSTAGLPALNVLEKQGVFDLVAVITRYFGGILLGTGGLVRAYSTAVVNGLKAAEVVTMCESVRCSVVCPYDKYAVLEKLFEKFSVKRIDTEFVENVVLTFGIKKQDSDRFVSKIQDTFCGRISIKIEEEYFDSY